MLLKRKKAVKADTASLDSAVSSKGIPIYDDAKDFVEDRIEARTGDLRAFLVV